jgi:hypothetical protein
MMNLTINYSQYNFSDIAQQTIIPSKQVTPLWECTNIIDIINTYQEFWYHYDIVIITVCVMEIMVILIIKDLYKRYRS